MLRSGLQNFLQKDRRNGDTLSMQTVSVIIPTKDRAHFLQEAIDSVTRQTQPVLEIIVVDMLSKDRSREMIARSFGEKVRFISKPFKNQSESRNYGIKLAKGDLIAFLDSDDLWLEKKIEEQVKFMSSRKYVFSYTDMVVIDEMGQETPHSYVYYHQKENPYFGKNIANKILKEYNVIPTSSVMAPKKILERVGGFDENLSYHEDRDLWIRLAQKGIVEFLNKVLGIYRVHSKQFTKKREKLREEQWEYLIRKHLK